MKILVVEDNALVAETIAEALIDGGYQVVGPASNLSAGLVLAQGEELDGALLDINLGGRLCFPIAWVLSERNVPFLFVTGYADTAMIPPELRSTWRLTKPFRIAELGAVAVKAFGTRAFGAS
ncbi:MAG TPA: response regulator [Stellaceae bacterium]|nr:response regulator [Stellaceae bacterium]